MIRLLRIELGYSVDLISSKADLKCFPQRIKFWISDLGLFRFYSKIFIAKTRKLGNTKIFLTLFRAFVIDLFWFRSDRVGQGEIEITSYIQHQVT
jgi:hypothetical protein